MYELHRERNLDSRWTGNQLRTLNRRRLRILRYCQHVNIVKIRIKSCSLIVEPNTSPMKQSNFQRSWALKVKTYPMMLLNIYFYHYCFDKILKPILKNNSVTSTNDNRVHSGDKRWRERNERSVQTRTELYVWLHDNTKSVQKRWK